MDQTWLHHLFDWGGADPGARGPCQRAGGWAGGRGGYGGAGVRAAHMKPGGKGVLHIGQDRRCGARATASTRQSPQKGCWQHGVETVLAGTST